MCHAWYMVRQYHCHCFDHAPINSARSFQTFSSAIFYEGPPDSILIRYSNCATGWMIHGLAAYRRKRYSLLLNAQTNWSAPYFIFSGYRVISLGIKQLELRLTTQLNLVPRLRMIGRIPRLPLYVCIG